jgi:hypothetical protein
MEIMAGVGNRDPISKTIVAADGTNQVLIATPLSGHRIVLAGVIIAWQLGDGSASRKVTFTCGGLQFFLTTGSYEPSAISPFPMHFVGGAKDAPLYAAVDSAVAGPNSLRLTCTVYDERIDA